MKIVIVGSGPAGLISASLLGESGHDIILIEKNKNIGGKILISGGGMCNFTHDEAREDFLKHYGLNGKKMKHALKQFTPTMLRHFLSDLGVKSYIRADRKVFPVSEKSQDIIEAFKRKLVSCGITIMTQTHVLKIERKNRWLVQTNINKIECDVLIIATGGVSYPQLGTSGDAYAWFKDLGLNIVKPRAGLAGISTNDDHADLAGISVKDVILTIKDSEKGIHYSKGDILFTHRGFSGPAILNASRYIMSGSALFINWINMDVNACQSSILNYADKNGKRQIVSLFEHFALPKQLMRYLCQSFDIDCTQKLATLSKKERHKVISTLTDYPVNNPQLHGFKSAMVTVGGLALTEISTRNFNILKYPDMYAVGEVIDIDGDTGGYNIQAAFSMGYSAAKHILKHDQQSLI